MDIQPFYGKASQPFLWAGSWPECETVISGLPNLHYCIIFIVYK